MKESEVRLTRYFLWFMFFVACGYLMVLGTIRSVEIWGLAYGIAPAVYILLFILLDLIAMFFLYLRSKPKPSDRVIKVENKNYGSARVEYYFDDEGRTVKKKDR